MQLACRQHDVAIGTTCVVAGLNCTFAAGAFWGVLGANGAGKTTLLRHFSGLLEPRAGELQLQDRALAAWPRRELARKLGMLQQHTSYVFDATVLQLALTGRHPWVNRFGRETAADHELARQALAAVELEGLQQRSVTTLSGGEARRLACAALLVQDPVVMLLDEPGNHLDFRHQVNTMRLFGGLVYGQGRLVIAALHDVNLAATYCSHVLLLFGDGNWQAGPAAELLTADNLQRLYQCPVNAVDTPEGRRFHPAFEASLT
jgi:iron complex transport system ATP-binding protein